MKNLQSLLETGEKITIEFVEGKFWVKVTFGQSCAIYANKDLIAALQKLDDVILEFVNHE